MGSGGAFDPTQFASASEDVATGKQPMMAGANNSLSYAQTKLEKRRSAMKQQQEQSHEKSDGLTSGYSLPLSAREVRSPAYNPESMFPHRSNQIKDIYNWYDENQATRTPEPLAQVTEERKVDL